MRREDMMRDAPIGGRQDSPAVARSAGLHYATDRLPGIRRVRSGKRFSYRGPDGTSIRDEKLLHRIARLAVPPAWTEVWIATDPSAHLQATGRDNRGRKQYRYHEQWRAVRDETKYAHLRRFGAALPRIRRRVAQDLDRPGLPREKVLAAVVRLMERTLARVGNPEYARENGSFGLTTLSNRHVRVGRGRIELDFRAKSGLRHQSVVADAKLARILRHCRDLPGSELFQYREEDGALRSIQSEDVNDYLRAVSGKDITAKDFRTWAATALALRAILDVAGQKPTKKHAAEIVRRVAQQLGNTPAVCRKCYIHPGLMSVWLDGGLTELDGETVRADRIAQRSLGAIERMLLRLLKRRELGMTAAPTHLHLIRALRASVAAGRARSTASRRSGGVAAAARIG